MVLEISRAKKVEKLLKCKKMGTIGCEIEEVSTVRLNARTDINCTEIKCENYEIKLHGEP